MQLTAFRVATWDTPLWVSANRRPSRYSPGGDIVQYWALDPLTPWAELLRYHDIRSADEARELRLRPWVARFELPDDFLELTFANSKSFGLEPDWLVADDHSGCQNWALANSAIEGLVAPSAALPGTRILVLFGPRVRVSFEVAPIDVMIDVPTDPVAEIGVAVEDILRMVRWRGDPHAGHSAWLAGDPPPEPPRVRVLPLP